jgi:hypothetical protein
MQTPTAETLQVKAKVLWLWALNHIEWRRVHTARRTAANRTSKITSSAPYSRPLSRKTPGITTL